MVAKTIGFNWGPAGTSTGVWTGVRLADVLRHCGMKSAEEAANYVCFRGPKNELPQGQFNSACYPQGTQVFLWCELLCINTTAHVM